jgi:hypothetical protein
MPRKVKRKVRRKARPARRRRRLQKQRPKFPWASLDDEALLQRSLSSLNVKIKGTWLERCVHDLYDELAAKGLRIRPHAWISDEWFSPDTTPGIAIPFYLAHPRLMALERKMIIDVEGGSRWECMRILRHEAGHVVQHAYQLNRRRRWQQLFGASSRHYPAYYRPNPASRHFVHHLRLWYAQSHPDEDFAETFAVWLRPRSDWRRRYAGWPALKKLQYVDELMAEIAGKRPLPMKRYKVDPLGRISRTLEEHYKRKLDRHTVEAPTIYDRELLRIFSANPRHKRAPAATTFIRHNRSAIREMVAKWTGEYQLTLDTVLEGMIDRCRELDLRAVGPERQLRMDFTVLLTAKTVHTLCSPSRRQWLAL